MAFRDNIGVQEELKVQMVDCTPPAWQMINRPWLEELLTELVGLRDPMNPRERLEKVITKVQLAVDTHKHLFG